MKKFTLVMALVLLLGTTACGRRNNNSPAVNNAGTQPNPSIYESEGYSISIPSGEYLYEKDYDDGNLEEKWEHRKKDDAHIKVTTYKNSDEISARERFLRENDDYIFEDLTGYPPCGIERDGDELWFNLYKSGENVYIVSWEYDKFTSDAIKKELSDIAGTFKLAE